MAGSVSDYESGKQRRYSLLFAVNGGAFAVVSLWIKSLDDQDVDDPSGEPILGALTQAQFGWGMALFCLLMFIDLWAFGWKHYDATRSSRETLFRWPGRLVLIGLSTLLISGWLLAMTGPCPPVLVATTVIGLTFLAWILCIVL